MLVHGSKPFDSAPNQIKEEFSQSETQLVDEKSPTATWRANAGNENFEDQPEDELDDSLTSLNWLHNMQGSIQFESNQGEGQNQESRSIEINQKVNQQTLDGSKNATIINKPIAKSATRALPNKPKSSTIIISATPQQTNTTLAKNVKVGSGKGQENGGQTVGKNGKQLPKKISITTIPAVKREPSATMIVNGNNLGLTGGLGGVGRTIGLVGRNGSNQGSFVPAVLSRGASTVEQGADFVPFPMNQFGSHPLAQSSMQGFSPQLSTNAKGSDAAQLLDDPDVSKYKYNHLIKPPFSYSTLICMAMKAKGSAIDGKITLTQLLNWIADNFSYYKHSDPAWQNNVFHALTTNKCFQKLSPINHIQTLASNVHEEIASGNSVWRISPAHQTEVDIMFKKRRQPPISNLNASQNISNTSKKARFTPSTMLDPNTVLHQQSGVAIVSQSAPPARSKRKQCVPDAGNTSVIALARRSNSSGPYVTGQIQIQGHQTYHVIQNPRKINNNNNKTLPGNISLSISSPVDTQGQDFIKQEPGSEMKLLNQYKPIAKTTSIGPNYAGNCDPKMGPTNPQVITTSKTELVNRSEQVAYSAPLYDTSSMTSPTFNCSLPPLPAQVGGRGGASKSLKAADSLLSSCAVSMVPFPSRDTYEEREETLVTEEDCLMISPTDEDILSQIDDLFFDISPPQSNSGLVESLEQSDWLPTAHNSWSNQIPEQNYVMSHDATPGSQTVIDDPYKVLSVRGSKIEPPLNWSPSPRNLAHLDQTNFPILETLDTQSAVPSDWLECSQTSLSQSNNSDWLRDSHERIMKGGQLSEEDLELSSHSLETRAFIQRIPANFVANQLEESQRRQSLKNNLGLKTIQSGLCAGIESGEVIPALLSSGEFNSPRMLDLSCLPEPLA